MCCRTVAHHLDSGHAAGSAGAAPGYATGTRALMYATQSSSVAIFG